MKVRQSEFAGSLYISPNCSSTEDPKSQPPAGRPLTGKSLPSALQRNVSSTPPRGTGQPRTGNLLIRRVVDPRPESRAQPRPGGQGAAGGARVPRAGGFARSPAQGQLLQRTGGSRPGQGQLLTRRSNPNQGQAQSPGRPILGRGGQQGRSGPAPNRTDSRVRRAERQAASAAVEEDEPTAASEVEDYISTVVDRPVNATTSLPHTPGKDLSDEELRKDWPPTPLSGAGLVEGVQQRIEWLAHRLPHGYHTPRQLALNYTNGYFTRFESAAERDEVLKISQDFAQKWAEKDAEKEKNAGKDIQPVDTEFVSVVDKKSERQGLADTWVRGVYPEVAEQKHRFANHIVRNFFNNPTITRSKGEQFMQTVQNVLVGHQQQQRAGGQGQTAAARK
jgi:hypothetical protein